VRSDLEKTPLSYIADYWRQLAEHSRQHFEGRAVIGVNAVVVDERHAVCDAGEVERQQLAGKGLRDARLLGIDRSSGLAVLELASIVSFPPLTRAAVEPVEGAWLAGVTLGDRGGLRVVPAHLASLPEGEAEDLDLAAPWPEGWGLGAVVDLDARLRGVTVMHEGSVRVLSAAHVRDIVSRAENDRRCQALDVAALSKAVEGVLRLGRGVFIERVEPGAFEGDQQPLAGDILLSWNGRSLRRPDDLARQYAAQAPGSLVMLRVWREGRSRMLRPRMPGHDCRPVQPEPWASAVFGFSVLDERPGIHEGLRIVFVDPKGAAARVGLAAGDVVLRVADRPAGSELSRRLLERGPRGSGPLLLHARRGDRVRLVALSAGGEGRGR
jgi:serine protease Do